MIYTDLSTEENKKTLREFVDRLIKANPERFFADAGPDWGLSAFGVGDNMRGDQCVLRECSVWQGKWAFLGPLLDEFHMKEDYRQQDKSVWADLSSSKQNCFFFAVFEAVCLAFEREQENNE